MTDFAAIDFETANGKRSSVCSVGIVIVRNGEIVDKFYSLIKLQTCTKLLFILDYTGSWPH
jgi:DNA polymerase III epsilon subunit-like protein